LGTGIWLVGQSEVGSHFWMAVALKFTGQWIQLDAGEPQFRLSGRFCPEELIERLEQLSCIEVQAPENGKGLTCAPQFFAARVFGASDEELEILPGIDLGKGHRLQG
jgi:hypothetical protein